MLVVLAYVKLLYELAKLPKRRHLAKLMLHAAAWFMPP